MSQSGRHFLVTARRSWRRSSRVGPAEEPVAVVDFINDKTGLEHDRVRDHGIVSRVGVFGDVEILLNQTPDVGEKRPVRAHSAAIFIGLGDIVGTDRDKAAIANLHLTMEVNQPFGLPAVLGAVPSPAEDQNHGMLGPAVLRVSGVFRCGRKAHSRGRPPLERCLAACEILSIATCPGFFEVLAVIRKFGFAPVRRNTMPGDGLGSLSMRVCSSSSLGGIPGTSYSRIGYSGVFATLTLLSQTLAPAIGAGPEQASKRLMRPLQEFG